MKRIKETSNWLVLPVGTILICIVFVGLSFSFLGLRFTQPIGQLVNIGGHKLHIQACGRNIPLPVIEAERGLQPGYFYWPF